MSAPAPVMLDFAHSRARITLLGAALLVLGTCVAAGAYAEYRVLLARRAGLDALRRFLAMLIERGMRLGAIEIEGSIDVDEAADLDAARLAIRKMP